MDELLDDEAPHFPIFGLVVAVLAVIGLVAIFGWVLPTVAFLLKAALLVALVVGVVWLVRALRRPG